MYEWRRGIETLVGDSKEALHFSTVRLAATGCSSACVPPIAIIYSSSLPKLSMEEKPCSSSSSCSGWGSGGKMPDLSFHSLPAHLGEPIRREVPLPGVLVHADKVHDVRLLQVPAPRTLGGLGAEPADDAGPSRAPVRHHDVGPPQPRPVRLLRGLDVVHAGPLPAGRLLHGGHNGGHPLHEARIHRGVASLLLGQLAVVAHGLALLLEQLEPLDRRGVTDLHRDGHPHGLALPKALHVKVLAQPLSVLPPPAPPAAVPPVEVPPDAVNRVVLVKGILAARLLVGKELNVGGDFVGDLDDDGVVRKQIRVPAVGHEVFNVQACVVAAIVVPTGLHDRSGV
ncbi:divalent metal cation transporter [Babesia caballi]|uniref:Divalent metal cation transporter n=1 Tax=Babesia caballi TaxID=5871 RepID=A0AAV4LXG4_BABCB|nr:divalent metal cation transporter [Babesia caballi]